jgi:hypothetical protein
MVADLVDSNIKMATDHEVTALLRALEGRFIAPAPGGDILQTRDVLPTGRNVHGFDPFKIPSAYALSDGSRQAQRLIDRIHLCSARVDAIITSPHGVTTGSFPVAGMRISVRTCMTSCNGPSARMHLGR